ncbi:DUF4389 domain-containing protein [Nocardioides rubriscoriae]|uniref:DUF4389 domain-containing protein n=1 Tax=Nocardioides rubriscoriae TaxID=642762 RepID=UPI0011DF00A5|nr:DUF4389 domain-containing protein [Nocardioides rubriscoriae]
MSTHSYPVRVDASLQERLSRWLWLVKWLLAFPHYVVLFFLWIAFAVLSVVAFFAILFTGRYPQSLFDFNVGVLRWSWRVAYYAYDGLATDRYPPFSLHERPDYPAHLEIEHPDHLSRGLVLVKWWLLAIPHYLVVAIFLGGGWSVASGGDDVQSGVGLIGLLVLVAAVVLLFTGRYPRPVFDLVLGLDRWVLRVAAYAALMTDEYPPFRLDQGGTDPGTAVLASTAGATGTLTEPGLAKAGTDTSAPVAPPAAPPAAPPGAPPPPAPGTWSAGRITAVVVGSFLGLVSLGLVIAGGTALVVDSALRDDDGYLTSSLVEVDSPGHAVVSESVELRGAGAVLPERWLDKVRVEATARPARSVFVGIAPTADVDAYLEGVAHSVVQDPGDGSGRADMRDVPGGAPPTAPGAQSFWAASATGDGTQALTWDVEQGDWTIVVMDADAGSPVVADVSVGATVPVLDNVGVALLLSGLGLGVVSVVVLVLALRRRPEA